MLVPNQWGSTHWDAVRSAFLRHFQHATAVGHGMARFVDWGAAYGALMHGKVYAVISDGYLIVYDVGCPWYSSTPLLLEEMVFRLGNTPGSFRSVIATLEQLAVRHGCKAIITGNAVGRRGLTRAYERAGFKTIATQMIKENRAWVSSSTQLKK